MWVAYHELGNLLSPSLSLPPPHLHPFVLASKSQMGCGNDMRISADGSWYQMFRGLCALSSIRTTDMHNALVGLELILFFLQKLLNVYHKNKGAAPTQVISEPSLP